MRRLHMPATYFNGSLGKFGFCALLVMFAVASIHWSLPYFVAIVFVWLCPIIVFPLHPETELASIRS